MRIVSESQNRFFPPSNCVESVEKGNFGKGLFSAPIAFLTFCCQGSRFSGFRGVYSLTYYPNPALPETATSTASHGLLLGECMPHTIVEDLAYIMNHAVEHPLDVHLNLAS